MKVCFETFGCRLNRAEALEMEAEYLAKGWELTKEHKDAQLFVVRGCSVTRRAQQDCEKLIAHLKRKYPNTPIKVYGCLADATSTKGQIRGEETPVPTRTARAYLKVQDGCSGKCSFCIVPKFRGASVSVPFQEVIDKAKRFIDAGYHEIVVTGCNLSLYASGGHRFAELMASLAALSPDCRFRIGSLEPGACALETVDVMAQYANICRFLHIPVQSGSPRILQAMRRPYSLRDVTELVNKASTRLPLIGLGCDLIAGFPGELDIDHVMTRGLLERLPFSNVHVFPYSTRPGTPAATFPDALSRTIRHTRARDLADLAREQRQNFAKKFMGHTVEIVLENEEKKTGWTSEYLSCEITNKTRVSKKRKELVKALVQDVHEDRLKAILV